jgi:hypothetical protein
MPLINQYENIFNSVVSETNRPDLVSETNLAISNGVIHFHNLDNWPLDAVELNPVYSYNEDSQTIVIDKCDQLPRYKKLATDSNDCAGTVTGVYINELCCPIVERTTNFAYRRCQYGFYEDALFITIKNNFIMSSSDTLTIAYYQHPLVDPIENLESWIASMYPQYIWTYAARQVQRAIGNNQQALSLGEEIVSFEDNLLKMHLPDQQ